MKKILKILFCFLNLPLIIFLKYGKSICHIRFGILNLSRIGSMTSLSTSYFLEKNVENKKTLDLIARTKFSANYQLKKMISKKIYLFPFEKLFRAIIFSVKYWLKDNDNIMHFNINSLSQIPKQKNFINFTETEIQRG